MPAERLRELVTDAHERIEGGQRLLEDEASDRAAQRAQCLVGSTDDLSVLQSDASRRDQLLGEQAECGERCQRLP